MSSSFRPGMMGATMTPTGMPALASRSCTTPSLAITAASSSLLQAQTTSSEWYMSILPGIRGYTYRGRTSRHHSDNDRKITGRLVAAIRQGARTRSRP